MTAAALSNGHNPNAGPQPLDIIAEPDRIKPTRGKFVAPEKKTGVPTANAAPARKSPPAKAAKKIAAPRKKKSA